MSSLYVRSSPGENNLLPSEIFHVRKEKENGKTVYDMAQSLTYFIRTTEHFDKVDLIEELEKMDLTHREKIQALSLVKNEFRNGDTSETSSFHIIAQFHEELISTEPHSWTLPQSVPSSLQVSLREGQLPEIPLELKNKILKFMKGELSAQNIGISESNHVQMLRTIKIVDLGLDRNPEQRWDLRFSTYRLRTFCLVASKGKMHTFEAYTKSIQHKYFESPFSDISRTYAARPENYLTERIGWHAVVSRNYAISSFALSRRLNNPKPIMYILRGNTASGKGYAVRTKQEFSKGLDAHNEVSGTYDPDTFKARLTHKVNGLTSGQVHIEGVERESILTKELRRIAFGISEVIDQRCPFPIICDLIKDSEATDKDTHIVDIDSPAIISTLRVLQRDPRREACVPFEVIASGLQTLRKDRREQISLVLTSPMVTSYELWVADPHGKKNLAARKIPGTIHMPARLEILDQALYEHALSEEEAEKEISTLKSTIITPALYMPFIGSGIDPQKLIIFEGLTIGEALENHSLTLSKW